MFQTEAKRMADLFLNRLVDILKGDDKKVEAYGVTTENYTGATSEALKISLPGGSTIDVSIRTPKTV